MRTDEKLARMREGGKILADILREVLMSVKPGVATNSLDALAENLCEKYSVRPAFKGYQGYPATVCIGPNDVVVHGIPGRDVLKEGDIVSVDMGIVYRDVYLDMARTVPVGEIADSARIFIDTVEEAMVCGCLEAQTGNSVGDIGHAISKTVQEKGYSVVREMVGHGVGLKLHESPSIPGYGDPGTGVVLLEGQTIAVEAIINEGSPDIVISRKDGWTSRTKDGKLSALFENTIAVSEESEILTPLSLQEP